MLVLLPKKIDGLKELENNLTTKLLKQCQNELQETEIRVFLPRFKISSGFTLNETLKSMGMIDAFSSRANFEGIDGRSDWLYIASILHQGVIEVNEEGSEASAATMVRFSARGGV